ncbi:PAS domain S-box protein [Methanoregula sp.]|uniref:PAS domain S-box protein n=1 Tax=Methanoregula sp. TaxID=2052170 RepID=UPI0026173AD6|nr:PAS domain S-box protein [Methanoregula sp.]MDD5142036.1 PAS domain S-box protein [Methanoregula sp.]
MIIEDDREHIELILHAFRQDPGQFRVETAATLRKAREIIARESPDLIIADWNLPDGRGIDIINREDDRVTTPLIIMTGYGDERLAVEIMKSGAVDYIVKSATVFEDLPNISRRTIRFWENLQERVRAERAQQETQKRLGDILAFLPDPVLAIDTTGTVIAWNNAMEDLTGVPAADMLGKGDHEYSIPFYGERRPLLIDLVLESDTEILNRYPFVQRDDDRITSETFVAGIYGGKGACLWGTATHLYDTSGNRVGAIEVIRDITERKQTEEIVRASEGKFRSLVEEVPDFILVHRNGKLLFVNRAASESTGYAHEDLIGKSMLDFIVPEDRERVIASMKQRMMGITVDPYEIRILTHTGQERQVIVRGNLIEFEGGPASLNVLTDITEMRRGEKALAESESRFRDLFNTMSSGVVIYEPVFSGQDFIIRDINRAVERIENVRKENVVGKSVLSVFPGVVEFGLFAVFQRVAETGYAEAFPVSLYKDNRISGWRDNYVYRLESGAIVAIYEDVTEKMQAEEAVRESNERFRFISHATNDTIRDWDLTTGHLWWNEGISNIFGYREDEIEFTIKTWESFVHPDERERVVTGLQRKIDTGGENWSDEYRFCKADGSYADVLDRGYIIRNAANEAVRMVGVILDLTERKAAERLLAQEAARRRILVDQSRDGIVTLDQDGRVFEANQRFADMLGYTPDEMKNLHVWDWEAVATKEQLEGMISSVNEGGDHFETRHRRKDGTLLDVDISTNAAVFSGRKLIFCVVRDISDKNVAARALEASEQKFRSLVEYALEIIFILDLQGNILFSNTAAARALGVDTPEELKGRNAMEFVAPESRKDAIRDFEEVAQGHDAYLAQYKVITAKGAEIYVESIGKVITYEGKPANLVSLRDVTARIRAEEAVRQNETRFSALIQNSSDIIRVLDREGKITYESDSAERILGLPRGSLIGKNPMDYIHPDDLEFVRQDLQGVFDWTNSGIPTEFRIRKSDGGYIWVEAIANNLLDVPGVNGIVVTTRPIQQRKEAEDAIRKSEQRLRLALEGADAGFWDWHVPSGTAVFSDRFYTMLGYEPGEFSADFDTWTGWIHTDDRKRVVADLQRKIQEGESQLEIEYRMRTKDGGWLWILGRGKVVEKNEDGTALRITGVNIDITNRRLLESEIRSLNTVLEQRVKDRTEALSKANEALEEENLQRIAAEEKLKASLEEKTMLLKEIHHRVKNNLQIIVSLLNLQSRQVKDESVLGTIRESQNRVKAMALVHEKLYRAEDISHIDLNDYVKFLGTGLLHFYDAKSRGIRFTLDAPDVRVDINTAIPLGLILNELISNALKYAFPKGRGGEISVNIKREEKTLTIIFLDDGIGIPPDFDWQNAPSLGLRLVNSLVDQLNGTIELDRSSGTRFTMVLHEKA